VKEWKNLRLRFETKDKSGNLLSYSEADSDYFMENGKLNFQRAAKFFWGASYKVEESGLSWEEVETTIRYLPKSNSLGNQVYEQNHFPEASAQQ